MRIRKFLSRWRALRAESRRQGGATIEPERTGEGARGSVVVPDLDGLSIVARQCLAAVCLERYCTHHGLSVPGIAALLDHIWKITAVGDGGLDFAEWEQGFRDLPFSGLGDDPPLDALVDIPIALREELRGLARDVVETSASCWYGADSPESFDHLRRVLRVMASRGVAIPDVAPFRTSDASKFGGWGSSPSPAGALAWRHGGRFPD